jgi:plastocyanin
MTSYIITIEVDPPGLQYSGGPPSTGNFAYAPSRLNVNGGDQITWTCNNPFSLEFQGGPPINDAHVCGNITTGTQYFTNSYTVKSGLTGSFHYAVAVYTASSPAPRIFMDSNCPVIVVN